MAKIFQVEKRYYYNMEVEKMENFAVEGGYEFFVKLFDQKDIDDIIDCQRMYNKQGVDLIITDCGNNVYSLFSWCGTMESAWGIMLHKYMSYSHTPVKVENVRYFQLIMVSPKKKEGLEKRERPIAA